MRTRTACSLAILAMLALLGGCSTASIPLSTPDADRDAKRFVVSPDKSAIYVYRDSDWLGTPLMLALDGKDAGWIPPGYFLLLEVSPGSHELLSLGGANVASLTIDAEPGALYYVSQEPVPGWVRMFPRTALYQVDAERGRDSVRQAKRLATSD